MDKLLKGEDQSLNDYLKGSDEREDLCAAPCCNRDAHIEYEGEMYCNYCYQDILDREGIDALDKE